jgi:hypothetical protein
VSFNVDREEIEGLRSAALHEDIVERRDWNLDDPFVWSGRALQESSLR